MDRQSLQTRIVLGTLCSVTIILSSITIAQIKRLYLPLPLTLAIINLLVPFVTIGAVLLSGWVGKSRLSPIFTALSSASTFVPFIILILSFVYGVPSDIQSCTGERRWLHYFRNHETAIRLIQDHLQCCGFNSLHDRAWPFPSHDFDARACERTLHYTIPCVDVWLQQESRMAGMLGFASFLNWVMLIILLTKQRSGAWSVPGISHQRFLAGSRPAQRVTEASYQDEPTV